MADTTFAQHEIFKQPTVGPVADEEAFFFDAEEAGLSDDARRSRWQSRRPRIDHLRTAVVAVPDGSGVLPLFDVGDRVVVEVRTKLLPPLAGGALPWLRTVVGRVLSIDDDTGVVTVHDEDADPRSRPVCYFSYKDGLHDFRFAPARGNPFKVEPSAAAAVVKPAANQPPQQSDSSAPNEGTRRRRGRPKGSKNRPKEVIQAEREALREAKRKKRGRRRAP